MFLMYGFCARRDAGAAAVKWAGSAPGRRRVCASKGNCAPAVPSLELICGAAFAQTHEGSMSLIPHFFKCEINIAMN